MFSEVKGVEKYSVLFFDCHFFSPVYFSNTTGIVVINLSCSYTTSLVKDYNNLRSLTQSTKQSEETKLTSKRPEVLPLVKYNGCSETSNHISFSIN